MARPIAEAFGRAFRDAYERAGLTQTQLAERLQAAGWVKVDQSQVSKWCRGVSVPPIEVLPDVDRACNRPLGYVLEIAGFVDAPALVARADLLRRTEPDPDDADEMRLWSLSSYSEGERRALIARLRQVRTDRSASAPAV